MKLVEQILLIMPSVDFYIIFLYMSIHEYSISADIAIPLRLLNLSVTNIYINPTLSPLYPERLPPFTHEGLRIETGRLFKHHSKRNNFGLSSTFAVALWFPLFYLSVGFCLYLESTL